MSSIVQKSFHRLFAIFKVYLVLATLGALLVIAWGAIIRYQQLANILLLSGATLFLLVTAIKRIVSIEMHRRAHAPPSAVADFLLYRMLPKNSSRAILGDLHEYYYSHVAHHQSTPKLQEPRRRIIAYLWYWKVILSCIPPLVMYRLDYLERDAMPSTDITSEIKERFKRILPFYRDDKHMTSASFFNDLFS